MKKSLFAPAFTTAAVICSSSPIVLSIQVKTRRMLLLPRQHSKQERNQSVCIRTAVKIEVKIYNQMNYTLWHEHTWFQVASGNGFV